MVAYCTTDQLIRYNVIGYYNMSPWLPSRVVEVEKSQKSLPLQVPQV